MPVLTHGFSALSCLIVDATMSAAQNTRVLLSSSGIVAVEIARNAEEVMAQLASGKYDVLIAEWDMKGESGLELSKRIRYAEAPIKPTIPILLLTNRSDPASAHEAFDAGVNELYVRPASPQGIAKSIHKIITQPRSFIISPHYRGPDRRTLPPQEDSHQSIFENRVELIPSITTIADLKNYIPESGARLIIPDFSLKAKINRAAIASGKVSFETIENEFIRDGLSDVDNIKIMFDQIEKAVGSRAPMERMCSASGLVQARSEAYDYELAAKVANYLTNFCKDYFNVHNNTHRLILEKHIQALQVILRTKVRGNGGQIGNELVDELANLMLKMM